MKPPDRTAGEEVTLLRGPEGLAASHEPQYLAVPIETELLQSSTSELPGRLLVLEHFALFALAAMHPMLQAIKNHPNDDREYYENRDCP
jgi:hypothetical protein